MVKIPGQSPRSIKTKTVIKLLESGSIRDIKAAKNATNDLLRYHWNYYSELAQQRSAIQDQIQQAIIQTSIPYEITNWQRAVRYKYGLHPLSTAGSLTYIGGRFNTGKGVNAEVPVFPGLYLAENKDTALQEHLGQEKNDFLTPREMALTNPASETIVSISGKLDKVFDLTNSDTLDPIVGLIKNFKLSKELKNYAKKLGLPIPGTIKTSKLLLDSILLPEWRHVPSQFDVPANSQIFGNLVYSAGIEGILYPSKLTKCPCLIVFPSNFVGTESYLSLDDEAPHEKVPVRLDALNWRISEMDIKEILMI